MKSPFERAGRVGYFVLLGLGADPDQAEDLVQQALFELIRSCHRKDPSLATEDEYLAQFKNADHLNAVVCRLARYRLFNLSRDRLRRALDLGAYAESHGMTPEDPLVERELASAISLDLWRLPRPQRVAVAGKVTGKPVAELAVLLGVSQVTVWRHYRRGFEKIRRSLSEWRVGPSYWSPAGLGSLDIDWEGLLRAPEDGAF